MCVDVLKFTEVVEMEFILFFFLQHNCNISVSHNSEEHGHDAHGPKTSTSSEHSWKKEEYEEGNPKPRLCRCLVEDEFCQLMPLAIKRTRRRLTMASVL